MCNLRYVKDNYMKKIKPLSDKGTTIEYFYKTANDEYDIKWGNTKFQLSSKTIKQIVNDFFKDDKKWYLLGASVTTPSKGGFGKFLTTLNMSFSPKHSSAIAAILVKEGILKAKGKRPIMLRKLIEKSKVETV